MDELIVYENNTALLNRDVAVKLAEFERMAKEVKAKQDELKQRILEEMESKGIVDHFLCSTHSKTFRKDHPDLYDEYVSISTVRSSIRMKVVSE